MAIEIYATEELIGVQRLVPELPENFWLRWFQKQINSTTQEIIFDKVIPDFRLAPFVAPNVQGRVMRERGYSSKAFTPAYLKPKHVIDPNKQFTRKAGERIGGSLTPAARFNASITENMATERAMIERTWDWMASQALQFGAITISAPDYPTTTIDYGRDASLTTVLAGTARWGQSAAAPLVDIATSRQAAFDLSTRSVNNLIFGTNAFKLFTEDLAVQKLLDINLRGNISNFNANPALGGNSAYEFQGVLQGISGAAPIQMWTYSSWYEVYNDTTGAYDKVPYLNTNDVVGVGSPDSVDGYQLFGAIVDVENLAAEAMFPKMWVNQDPSVAYTMTQSAPLMVPLNVNNTFRIRVT